MQTSNLQLKLPLLLLHNQSNKPKHSNYPTRHKLTNKLTKLLHKIMLDLIKLIHKCYLKTKMSLESPKLYYQHDQANNAKSYIKHTLKTMESKPNTKFILSIHQQTHPKLIFIKGMQHSIC